MTNSHPHLLRDKQVLLIENDEVSQMLIGYMLRKQGATVNIATSREEVMTYMKTNTADLIFMDTSLSSTNALDFTRSLREEMDIQVPIIGMAVTDLRGRGIYHGLDYVMRKPIQYPEMKKILQKFGFED